MKEVHIYSFYFHSVHLIQILQAILEQEIEIRIIFILIFAYDFLL